MNELKQFAERFNQSAKAKPSTQDEIENLEQLYRIYLPDDYKYFLLNFGNIWTPDILDLIGDNKSDVYDVAQFWTIDKIIYDKQNEWTSHVFPELIPIASDSSGNIIAFLKQDLNISLNTANIYFYDHDFDTVEKIAESFTGWIDAYNKI